MKTTPVYLKAYDVKRKTKIGEVVCCLESQSTDGGKEGRISFKADNKTISIGICDNWPVLMDRGSTVIDSSKSDDTPSERVRFSYVLPSSSGRSIVMDRKNVTR